MVPGPEAPTAPQAPAAEAGARRNLIPFLSKTTVLSIGAVETLVVGAVLDAVKDTAKSFIPSAQLISNFVKSYPALTIGGIALAITATLAATYLVWRLPQDRRAAVTSALQRPRVVYSSFSIAVFSSGVLIAVLVCLMVRPAWCPSQICQVGLAAYPGPNDGYIGAEVFAIQSDTILIPGDPSNYSLGHMPDGTGPKAVAADLVQQATGVHAPANPAYRVAFRLQSLRSDMGEMSIEQVALLVTRTAAPGRVNAWYEGNVVDLEQNPHITRYSGQAPGQLLVATWVDPTQFGHVQLSPGESDIITVRLWSDIPIELTYRIQVTYRFLGHSELRTFQVPQNVEVVFASQLQWTEYQLRNGKLQPG